jgi:RNA-directed DNA polymerase
MQSTCEFIEQRLKLRVNRDKSAVDRATRRTLLGFGFFKREGEIKVRIDPKARKRAEDRLRRLTSRRWGIDGAEDHFDQPLQPGVDGLLCVVRHTLGLRGTR